VDESTDRSEELTKERQPEDRSPEETSTGTESSQILDPIAAVDAGKDPELVIAETNARLRRLRRMTRVMSVALLALALLLLIVGIVVTFAVPDDPSITEVPWSIYLYGGAAYAALGSGLAFVANQFREARIEADLEVLAARRRTKELVPASATSSYFERLVAINVDNLGAYYALAKFHTENAFRVAMAAGIVGFLLIVGGLIAGYFGSRTDTVAYVSAGAGVAVEFIAAIFFYLYNRTVLQLKDYHASLIAVQNVLLAFKLVEDSPGDQRSALVAELLSLLMGTNPSDSGRSIGTGDAG
jgi:hypothetical protein